MMRQRQFNNRVALSSCNRPYYSIWEGMEEFEKANEQRFASYLLADELRDGLK